MKSRIYLALAIVCLGAYSCVSPKKLEEAEAKYGQLNGAYAELQGKYRDAQDAITKSKTDAERAADRTKSLQSTIDDLNKQVDFLRTNNNVVLSQLKDMSVVTGAQAESINKSLDNIGARNYQINRERVFGCH